MTDDELFQEIQAGESKTTEFKLMLPARNEKYIKTLVAFANTVGGKLIIGIDDEAHSIVGVSEATEVMDMIASTLSQTCLPILTPNIHKRNINGKDIVIVEIYPGSNTPYYIKSQGVDKGTYVRVGATTHHADEVMIRELQLRGASQSYDEQIYVDMPYSKEDSLALCNAIERYRQKSAEAKGNEAPKNKVTPKTLENWGVLKCFDGRLVPTRAFMLLTSNPFEFAQIQCAQFKGTDRIVFLDKREYGGPLYEQIEEAVQFVLRNIKYGAEIKGLLRENSFELPIIAIREAIVNATIHRSFQLTSCVQVALYDDRLEVSSPGALFGSLTLEKALAGSTALRNPKVAEVFKQMDLFESWGTGLRRIQESCEKLGLPEPEFQVIGDLFRVNIFRLVPETKVAPKQNVSPKVSPKQNVNQKVTPKVNQKTLAYNPAQLEEEILRLLKENPEISQVHLADITSLSRSSIQRCLASLKETGRIKRVGSNRAGSWIVIE